MLFVGRRCLLKALMSTDPRSEKHYKLCQFEIKSMQLGPLISVTIDRLLANICETPCIDRFNKSNSFLFAMQWNVFKGFFVPWAKNCPWINLTWDYKLALFRLVYWVRLKKIKRKNPGHERHAKSFLASEFCAAIFLMAFFCIAHDGLSKRLGYS